MSEQEKGKGDLDDPNSKNTKCPDKFEQKVEEYLEVLNELHLTGRTSGFCMRNFTVEGAFNPKFQIRSFFAQLLHPINIIFRTGPKRDIIPLVKGFDGYLQPGSSLLVLGHEGSGGSTLLKALCGIVEENERLNGSLHYDGLDYKIAHSQFKADLSYCGEGHSKVATITVRRLLEFVCSCRLPASKYDHPRSHYIRRICEIIRDAFDLGDFYNHRILRVFNSGDQIKVDVAQTMCARPLIQCWDNNMRDFDSISVIDILSRIKVLSHKLGTTLVAIVSQASDRIFHMFDMVTLMYEGEQIFYGPTSRLKPYFLDLGFIPAKHSTTVEFVTSLTYPEMRIINKKHQGFIPSTPAEFRECWLRSEDYAKLIKFMDRYEENHSDIHAFKDAKFDQTRLQKFLRWLNSNPCLIPYRLQVFATAKVTFFQYLHDYSYIATFVFTYVFQALMLGSLFYNLRNESSELYSRGSVLSNAIVFTAIQTMSEVDIIFLKKSLFKEHRVQSLYHPSAALMGSNLVEFPMRIVVVTMYDIIVYFLSDLKRNARSFFIFYLFTIVITFCMSAVFRFVALLSTTAEIAALIGGIGALVLIIFCGAVMPVQYIGWWFRWIAYANPVNYGYESIMLNEFDGREIPCSLMAPAPDTAPIENNFCLATAGRTGTSIVSGYQYLQVVYQYKADFLWRNCGIILGFAIFILASSLILANFIRYDRESVHIPEFQKRKSYSQVASSFLIEPQDKPPSQTEPDNKKVDVSTTLSTNDNLVLCWRDLNFTVVTKTSKKQILTNVSGYLKKNTLTALLGENKSGKSVLLRILSQRGIAGSVEGEITLSGLKNPKNLRKRIGYVRKNPLFISEYTVRETLRLHAALRQSKQRSLSEQYAYVEYVIDFLGLGEVADFIVGDMGIGLSLYHKRLLSIAVELSARPGSILLLDEPANGLDSQSAWMLVCILQKLARSGLSILCSVSQPSSRILELFDMMLILDLNGNTVYYDTMGRDLSKLVNYFKRIHGTNEHSKDTADFVLHCIQFLKQGPEFDYAGAWASTNTHKQIIEHVNFIMDNPELTDDDFPNETRFMTSFFFQIYKISMRNFVAYWRDSSLLRARIAFNIVAGLIIGFSFYKQGVGVEETQNKMFSAYMLTVASTSTMNGLQPKFIYFRSIYEQYEQNTAIYSRTAFIIAFFLVEAVINCCFATLFFFGWYYPSGFYEFNHNIPFYGGFAWLMLMIFTLYYTTLGIGIATISPSIGTASIISGTAFVFIQYFNGMIQLPGVIVGFWKWMDALSPYKYFLEGMIGGVLHDAPITCEKFEIHYVDPPPNYSCGEYFSSFLNSSGHGIVYNPEAYSSCQYCPYKNADELMVGFGYHYNHKWRNFCIMIGYTAFNLGAAIALYYIIHKTPWKRLAARFVPD